MFPQITRRVTPVSWFKRQEGEDRLVDAGAAHMWVSVFDTNNPSQPFHRRVVGPRLDRHGVGPVLESAIFDRFHDSSPFRSLRRTGRGRGHDPEPQARDRPTESLNGLYGCAVAGIDRDGAAVWGASVGVLRRVHGRDRHVGCARQASHAASSQPNRSGEFTLK